MDNKKSGSGFVIAIVLLLLVGGLSVCIGAITGLSNKVTTLQKELKDANNQVQAKEVDSNQYTNSEIDTKFDLINTQIDNKILKVNEELKKLQDDKKDDSKDGKEIDLVGNYKVTKISSYNESEVNKSSIQIKEDGTIIVCGLRWGMTASSGNFPHCITFSKK